MIIFKDVISGDEVFSDVYKSTKLIDDMYYEVIPTLQKIDTDISADLIGGNASAEGADADEGVAGEQGVTGLNVVLSHNLKQVNFGEDNKKKNFKAYFKKYCKLVVSKLSEERKQIFMKGMDGVMKMILANMKTWDFYAGENWDEMDETKAGLVIFLDYREDDKGNEYPYMVFLKDGLLEEKV